jgi:hypothetical protein
MLDYDAMSETERGDARQILPRRVHRRLRDQKRRASRRGYSGRKSQSVRSGWMAPHSWAIERLTRAQLESRKA